MRDPSSIVLAEAISWVPLVDGLPRAPKVGGAHYEVLPWQHQGAHDSRGQGKHASGRHRSSNKRWRSEVLVANSHNTSGSETHCNRAGLPSPAERRSAEPYGASAPCIDLLHRGT